MAEKADARIRKPRLTRDPPCAVAILAARQGAALSDEHENLKKEKSTLVSNMSKVTQTAADQGEGGPPHRSGRRSSPNSRAHAPPAPPRALQRQR